MSTTPSISSKITSSRPDVDFGRDLKGANVPQFDQVMNLVQPKIAHEAVKAYESHAQDRSKVEGNSDREIKQVDRDTNEQVENVDHGHDSQENAHVAQVAVAQQSDVDVEGQRAKLLKMINQLSQDDLLSIVEWRGDLSLQASALDTQLNLDNLPKVEGISTSDMMALLNGFKQLEIPTDQLPHLDGPQVANWLEAQWAASKSHLANNI